MADSTALYPQLTRHKVWMTCFIYYFFYVVQLKDSFMNEIVFSNMTFECSENIKSLIFLENLLYLTSLDFSDRNFKSLLTVGKEGNIYAGDFLAQ